MYLEWHEDKRINVHTVEALDREIDRLAIEARDEMPFSVELHLDEHNAIMMVVGREESHVEFVSATQHPWINACIGPWDDDTPIEFTHRGQWSSVPRRYWVSTVDAREGLRRFFESATRPDNLAWNEEDQVSL